MPLSEIQWIQAFVSRGFVYLGLHVPQQKIHEVLFANSSSAISRILRKMPSALWRMPKYPAGRYLFGNSRLY